MSLVLGPTVSLVPRDEIQGQRWSASKFLEALRQAQLVSGYLCQYDCLVRHRTVYCTYSILLQCIAGYISFMPRVILQVCRRGQEVSGLADYGGSHVWGWGPHPLYMGCPTRKCTGDKRLLICPWLQECVDWCTFKCNSVHVHVHVHATVTVNVTVNVNTAALPLEQDTQQKGTEVQNN